MKSEVIPIISYDFRSMCFKPYPNHPTGCPNFGKRSSCPPCVPVFEEVFDVAKPLYVIWTTFPIGTHIAKMKALHPNWSERQLTCCLYWQGSARKNLKREIFKFQTSHPSLFITTCPEAMGVNVTATMASIGEKLEWPPLIMTYQVAIAGTRLAKPCS